MLYGASPNEARRALTAFTTSYGEPASPGILSVAAREGEAELKTANVTKTMTRIANDAHQSTK
jgi:hypothetical protein